MTFFLHSYELHICVLHFAMNHQCQGVLTRLIPKFGATAPRRGLARFRIIEHVVVGQHVRHWPRGRNLENHEPLRIAVKQYIPNNDSQPSEGDITIVGAHANGFPKELYEPLWDDLAAQMEAANGRRIRSIWIADMANQAQSGALNEQCHGNDPSWYDLSRDLLSLINQKQTEMPSPLVGIGHSVGAAQLAYLSMFHPRLFQALVLIEPTIQTENPGKDFAPASTYRRDMWPSRQEAREQFARSKFYQAWDPRVFEKWIEFGLYSILNPHDPSQATPIYHPVTLATTVSQEVFLYERPMYESTAGVPVELDKLHYGDAHPDDADKDYPFYRPEPAQIFRRLPELYPPVSYIFGTQSPVSTPELRQKKVSSTGTGVGGSGGRAYNRVEEVLLDGGHMVPLERVNETASAIVSFNTRSLDRWDAEMKQVERLWFSKPFPQRAMLDEE